jgi:NTE family protein
MSDQETRINGDQEKKADLVFQGGGVKGIGLVGAYSVLEEQGYQPQNTAGASAGAITAALIAAGYTAEELHEILGTLDFSDFKDRGWEDYFPFIPVTISILKDRGVYEGAAFSEWMRDKLAKKNVRTFGDLIRPGYEDAELRYRYKAQVIVSDVTERQLLVLPRDADQLGYGNADDLEVALAVRMSMSIPFFFEPVKFTHLKSGREHLIVDGGMLSNFPVWLFDVEEGEEAQQPTFGMRLVEPDPRASLAKGVSGRGRALMVVDYIRSLVETMMEAHDRFAMRESDFKRTIDIDTLGVRTTEFELAKDPGRVEALYQSGRSAAEEFLATLDGT